MYLLISVVGMALAFDLRPAVVLRYFAALLLGADVLTNDSAGTLVVGLVVHLALSLVFALVIAIVVHRWGLLVGIFGGGLLGLALYAINLYTMTRFFEWFFAINSPALLAAHMVYGMVVGGVYELFDHYDQPLIQEKSA